MSEAFRPIGDEAELRRALLSDELFWRDALEGMTDDQKDRLLAFVDALKSEDSDA